MSTMIRPARVIGWMFVILLSFSELSQEPGGATAEATGHPSRARTGFDRCCGARGEYWHPGCRT